jgi:hypothetical protein
MRRTMLLAVWLGLLFAWPGIVEAQVLAKINLTNQRTDVYVDGAPVYNWPVSTARCFSLWRSFALSLTHGIAHLGAAFGLHALFERIHDVDDGGLWLAF